jgi:hypothetical protein
MMVLTISGDDAESEPAAFARDLLSGVLYVVDRNFVHFSFIGKVLEKDTIRGEVHSSLWLSSCLCLFVVFLEPKQEGHSSAERPSALRCNFYDHPALAG